MAKTNPLRVSSRFNWMMTAGCIVSAALPAAGAFAAQPGRAVAPPARTAAPAPAAESSGAGLDGLSDESLMTELAARGQDTLLNRLFEVRRVPQAQRDRIVASKAITQLVDSMKQNAKPLSNAQRLRLVRESVAGLRDMLPSLKNPDTLMTYAGALITLGVEPDINTIEYWGENPVTQARVKPVAEMASAMLKKVAVDAEAESTRIEQQMNRAPNDQLGERWMKLYELGSQARYVDGLVQYYIAMATDVSGNNQAAMQARAKVAEDAMKYLEQFDAPAEDPKAGGIQPLVRLRRAKLAMAKKDFDTARKLFESIITGKMEDGKKNISPAPTPGQVYEAKYFSVQSDVLGGKLPDADKGFADLVSWQQKNMPAESQAGIGAASEMLRFRLLSAKADASKDPAEKAKLGNEAAAVLTALGEKFPQFQGLITEQLVNRLPENADLSKQPPLVLTALVAKGVYERNKPEGQPLDNKVLERAARAAELMSNMKPAPPAVTASMIEDATLAVPLFYDRLGRKKEAAKGYLDYAARFLKTQPKSAGEAVDRAFGLAYELYKAQTNDGEVKELYGRAIKTAAYQPYGRKELFYLMADYLRTVENNNLEAVKFYNLVPKGDKSEFPARFFALVALNAQLDKETNPQTRQQLIVQMSGLIDQVRGLASARANDPVAKTRLALTTLLGANLAIQQKNPQRALELLNGFEQSVGGEANAGDLALQASRYRAMAFMASGQLAKATDEVVRLAGDPKTSQAAISMVGQLLEQLNKDYDRAEQNNDNQEKAAIAKNQAALTGFLTDWAKKNKPAQVGEFMVYDADTKRKAGMLLDGDSRKKALTDALRVYQEAGKTAKENVKVDLGVALTQYELGDYAASGPVLATLLRDGKLGGPQIIEPNAAGEQTVKDNPTYWEATYKWLKGGAELGKKSSSSDAQKAAVQTLKNLYITHREKLGGERWAKQFTDLRQELIPDFKLENLAPTTGPTTAPATQPVAARGGI